MIIVFLIFLGKKIDYYFWEKVWPLMRRYKKTSIIIYIITYTCFCYWILFYSPIYFYMLFWTFTYYRLYFTYWFWLSSWNSLFFFYVAFLLFYGPSLLQQYSYCSDTMDAWIDYVENYPAKYFSYFLVPPITAGYLLVVPDWLFYDHPYYYKLLLVLFSIYNLYFFIVHLHAVVVTRRCQGAFMTLGRYILLFLFLWLFFKIIHIYSLPKWVLGVSYICNFNAAGSFSHWLIIKPKFFMSWCADFWLAKYMTIGMWALLMDCALS